MECENELVGSQFGNFQPELDQIRTVAILELSLVQQIGHHEIERETKALFQKRASLKIYQDGRVRDDHLHVSQASAAASMSGGAFSRRLSS